jgi:hypothetical protein
MIWTDVIVPQIVPAEIKAAYLYVKADASASATLTVEGIAKVSYDSSVVQFAKCMFHSSSP